MHNLKAHNIICMFLITSLNMKYYVFPTGFASGVFFYLFTDLKNILISA